MVGELIRALVERIRARIQEILGRPLEYAPPAAPVTPTPPEYVAPPEYVPPVAPPVTPTPAPPEVPEVPAPPYVPPVIPTPPLSVLIAANPLAGRAPLSVGFTAQAAGGESPYAFSWVFGDGTMSTEQNPTHAFIAVGDYGVECTATDASGKTKAVSITITTLPAGLTSEERSEAERLLAVVAEERSVASGKGCSMPAFVEETLAVQYLVLNKIEALGKAQIAVQRATQYVDSIRVETLGTQKIRVRAAGPSITYGGAYEYVVIDPNTIGGTPYDDQIRVFVGGWWSYYFDTKMTPKYMIGSWVDAGSSLESMETFGVSAAYGALASGYINEDEWGRWLKYPNLGKNTWRAMMEEAKRRGWIAYVETIPAQTRTICP